MSTKTVQHMPGPWRFVECLEIEGQGNAYEVEIQDFTIAHVFSGPDMEANARLIALAPELLEHLRLATSGDPEEHGPEFWEKWNQDAEKLIAKAEGK
jgi:hypothetical protein